MTDLATVTIPKRDLVSLLEWAAAMPGFHLRDDARRLQHAVGVLDDECEGDYEQHELAAVGAISPELEECIKEYRGVQALDGGKTFA